MNSFRRFLVDFMLAAMGLVLGGGVGYFGCKGFYGNVNDPVVDTLAPFAAVVCGGVLGIIGANVRSWVLALWPKRPKQVDDSR